MSRHKLGIAPDEGGVLPAPFAPRRRNAGRRADRLPAHGDGPRDRQIDFTDLSLYGLLESRYDLHPVGATETLIAVVVNGEDANLLRVQPGSPALAAERTTYLPHGERLEYAQSIMRGDRYKVVLDLTKLP